MQARREGGGGEGGRGNPLVASQTPGNSLVASQTPKPFALSPTPDGVAQAGEQVTLGTDVAGLRQFVERAAIHEAQGKNKCTANLN